MSFENGGFRIAGFVAGEAIANAGTFVRLSGAADFTLLIADNAEEADGVCLNTPAIGEAVDFLTPFPVVKCRVGTGGITRGEEVGLELGGSCVSPADGDAIVGKACETAAASTTASVLLGAKLRAFEPDAAIADLTHAVGTADGTVDDVGASFNQTTLNNNFREITDTLDAIQAALRQANIIEP